ncbi:MAG TPA: ribosome biogenesis GTPase YlqF [Firmicutes bacterium]|nr:ribosome biogenesis GTPase YlqF [Bacillota bacterium]
MEIQWYPGHMAKTKRELKAVLPLLDLILEVADARIPASSRNPDLSDLIGKKARILILNKVDLADPLLTDQWLAYYRETGERVVSFNARTGEKLGALENLIHQVACEAFPQKAVGRLGVVGVPNCGKSSLLNRLVRRSAARVGERPGVTRGRQWVKRGKWEILDTPGLLWPKIADQETGFKLALVGMIKPENLATEELILAFLDWLRQNHPSPLLNYYGLGPMTGERDPYDLLLAIGARRGCLQKGGEVNLLRTAELIWTDFRLGKLGPITLEQPTVYPVS